MDDIIIRPFTHNDIADVIAMDEKSGNNVQQWVAELEPDENNDYSWGIYVNDELAGYCTIGYADDVCRVIENHPLNKDDAYLISDVYVKPEFRHNGYGLKLITETIKGRFKSECEMAVFLNVFYDDLKNFYSKAGFECIPDDSDFSCMVYDPNKQPNTKGDATA